MNVLDDKGNILSAVKLKEATLNVTLARQTLIELIQSYVNPQCIYTDHDVIRVENVEQHTMVHFSNHASQSFDLCIYRTDFILLSDKLFIRMRRYFIKGIRVFVA